jgi:TPR repeat protein
MKIIVITLLILVTFSCSSKKETSDILTEEVINKVKIIYPDVDIDALNSANRGNINAAIETSNILFRLNNEELVKKGIELLVEYSIKHEIARLHLGMRHLEGIEIIPQGGKPKRIVRDYDRAINYLEQYLANSIENNDQLFLIAFTMLGSAYIKNEDYHHAADHFLKNEKLIEADSTGQSAYELAGLYKDGNGMEESKEKAFYWYDLSAQKGFNMAIMERNFLAIELGKE